MGNISNASNNTSNTSLYRKYRPKRFSDMIGQEQVIIPLQRSLDAKRTVQSYIFSGPRGSGKTTSARIFAKCLNCKEGPTKTPCDKCPSCLDMNSDSKSLDVIEIDAASNNGVDDAREIRERALLAPIRDKYKIFIFDEAHMITTNAFNALLKIIEEPPEHVKFIFATTEFEKLIPTIISRSHHYPFALLHDSVLIPYLKKICESENVLVSDQTLLSVSLAGGGSVRDSLSILDQLIISAVKCDGNNQIDDDIASKLIGMASKTLINETINGIIKRDLNKLFEISTLNTSINIKMFLNSLLAEVMIILAVKLNLSTPSVKSLSEENLKPIKEMSQKLEINEINIIFETVSNALRSLDGTVSGDISMVSFATKIITTLNDLKSKQACQALEHTDQTNDHTSPIQINNYHNSHTSNNEEKDTNTNKNTSKKIKRKTIDDVLNFWDLFLAQITTHYPLIGELLSNGNSTVDKLENNEITLSFYEQSYFNHYKKLDTKDKITIQKGFIHHLYSIEKRQLDKMSQDDLDSYIIIKPRLAIDKTENNFNNQIDISQENDGIFKCLSNDNEQSDLEPTKTKKNNDSTRLDRASFVEHTTFDEVKQNSDERATSAPSDNTISLKIKDENYDEIDIDDIDQL